MTRSRGALELPGGVNGARGGTADAGAVVARSGVGRTDVSSVRHCLGQPCQSISAWKSSSELKVFDTEGYLIVASGIRNGAIRMPGAAKRGLGLPQKA